MATASVLASDSLKFALSSGLVRPLPHKPCLLIPCRPSPRARSLTLKAQRISKFNDAPSIMNERLTIFSKLLENDSPFESGVDVFINSSAEALDALRNPAVLIVMVAAVMFWAFNPAIVRDNINTAIVDIMTTFTLKTFSVLLLLTFTVIVILLALLFVVSLLLLCRTITAIVFPHILREAICFLFRPVRSLLSPLLVMKTSVLKVQVGLSGKGKSLQKDLNCVAQAADSSSFLLTETLVALLSRLDCCTSGYSRVDIKQIMEDGEKHFNRLSIEERGKIDEDKLVSVNGVKNQTTMTHFNNEYIVITFLAVAEGVYNLPVINDSGDLKEALQILGSIPTNRIRIMVQAIEVLWTPQKENDTLTEQELLEYYPLLRPF